MSIKLLRCNHCGNIIEKVLDTGVPVVCCGEKMEVLEANTTDAATEKHVPVVNVDGHKVFVKVGEVTHPMEEKHHIQWIFLETDKGVYRKALNPGDAPEALFCLADDKPIAAYEYCNLHGFWKKEI